VGLLVMQALAVHRDTAVAVELLSLRWGCLIHWPTVGSLLILFATVPPGARDRPGLRVRAAVHSEAEESVP
jgi:hypothetical protein